MISRPSTLAALVALALHAALLALVLTGRMEPPKPEVKPPTVVVQLLPPPAPPAPPAPKPPPPKPKPPPPKPQPPKPEPPKPAPPKPEPPRPEPPKPEPPRAEPPRPAPTPAPVQLPVAPSPAPAPVTAPAPPPAEPAPPRPAPPPPAPPAPPPPAPPAPPAPVARTEVNISASYGASNMKPVYPRMSQRLGEQGTVVLRVLVKGDGTAGSVEVKSSSGFPRLDQAAIDAVKTWRFNPATVDGKAVDEWYQVPIPFKLQN